MDERTARAIIAGDTADGIPCYCDDCRDAYYFLDQLEPMNTETRLKIKYAAPLIFQHWKEGRSPGTIEPPYSTAVELLGVLADSGGTVEQLAEALRLHPNTIFEYVSALKEGGIRIKNEPIAPEPDEWGRPRSHYSLG